MLGIRGRMKHIETIVIGKNAETVGLEKTYKIQFKANPRTRETRCLNQPFARVKTEASNAEIGQFLN